MEKLLKVTRLRLTDELDLAVRQYMATDDREHFEETLRHLIRVGLRARQNKGLDVASGERDRWNGLERRKGTR